MPMMMKVQKQPPAQQLMKKLFEMLKELRQKEAKRKSLPPFVILP